MSDVIKNRSEILFLYDVKDSNPNGDPLDENKPRIDEETMRNIVTDVRLKRTIRDYLNKYKNKEIFVKSVKNEDGSIRTRLNRLEDLKITTKNDVIEKCIDVRLFGATIAVKDKKKKEDTDEKEKKSITFTGPVQFKIGRSLHRVNPKFIKGTTVFPGDDEKIKYQGTFTEMYVLPYSLICFYGVVNENAAKDTKLTEEDVKSLLDGLWNGTKNLITRSKVGQMPRLLLKINYKEKNYHIGDLNALMKLESDKREEEIRDASDYTLNVTSLLRALSDNRDKVKDVDLSIDPVLQFTCDGKPAPLGEILQSCGLTVNTLRL